MYVCWQLAELAGRGWKQPSPEYDDADKLLGCVIFVMEHGFGKVSVLFKIASHSTRPFSPLHAGDTRRLSTTMRVELTGHCKPCMTDIYLHI